MSSKSAKYLKANTSGAHFGIIDSITLSDSATYLEDPIRLLKCTAAATVKVDMIDGSTGTIALAAGEWSPNLQVTKVYLTGTNLNAGSLQGLI